MGHLLRLFAKGGSTVWILLWLAACGSPDAIVGTGGDVPSDTATLETDQLGQSDMQADSEGDQIAPGTDIGLPDVDVQTDDAEVDSAVGTDAAATDTATETDGSATDAIGDTDATETDATADSDATQTDTTADITDTEDTTDSPDTTATDVAELDVAPDSGQTDAEDDAELGQTDTVQAPDTATDTDTETDTEADTPAGSDSGEADSGAADGNAPEVAEDDAGPLCTDALACSDNNPCTDDQCQPEVGCVHLPVAATCDDGDACTQADGCVETICVGAAVDCNDGNSCTADDCTSATGCGHTAAAATCEDGDPCTTGDSCENSTCSGQALTCDDGTVCTTDSCTAQDGCIHLPAAGPCTDNDACTEQDTCTSGDCLGVPVVCQDNNPCTADDCAAQSGCTALPTDATCTDSDACTVGDTCSAGKCTTSGNLPCDDGQICTLDSCLPASGCHNVDTTGPCQDGDACTEGETCATGSCEGGAAAVCKDGQVCTVDDCDPVLGCVFLPLDVTCSDDSACTADDGCVQGLCVGTPVDCGDDDPCTDPSCNPLTGCEVLYNTAPCADADPCVIGDTCAAGVCLAGSVTACDDGNACTLDTCTAGACLFQPTTSVCNDGDPCSQNDQCAAGACKGTALDCEDGNVCTTDSCSGGLCKSSKGPNGVACDADGSVCTDKDSCLNGACKAGTTVVCNDNNPCTVDACLPATGCDFAEIGYNATCPAGFCQADQCVACPDGTLTTNLDDNGVKKTVCGLNYPAWGIRPDLAGPFTDNGDGTVTDQFTGLVWQQGFDNDTEEDETPAYCDNLVLGGKYDWRLPTITELGSLIDYTAVTQPPIDLTAFPNTPADQFYTIDEDAKKYLRWHVDFGNAGAWVFAYSKRNIRCVRGEADVYHPPTRFEVSNSGATVLDKATSRVWQRTPSTVKYTYANAIAYCGQLVLDDYDDWRAPNALELTSVVDRMNFETQPMDMTVFPPPPDDEWTWTASPISYPGWSGHQVALQFGKSAATYNVYGCVTPKATHYELYVRCVR